jgi:hypothetical protein
MFIFILLFVSKSRIIETKLKTLKLNKKKQQENLQQLLKNSVSATATTTKTATITTASSQNAKTPSTTNANKTNGPIQRQQHEQGRQENIKKDDTSRTSVSIVADKVTSIQKYNEKLRTLIENSKLKSLNSTPAESRPSNKSNHIKPNIIHKKSTLEVLENFTLTKYQIISNQAPSVLSTNNTDSKAIVYDYYHPLSFVYVKLIDSYLFNFNFNKKPINLKKLNISPDIFVNMQDMQQTHQQIDILKPYASPLLRFKGYR